MNIDPGGGVPEPATWAMMIGGFGATAAAIRRRVRVAIDGEIGARAAVTPAW